MQLAFRLASKKNARVSGNALDTPTADDEVLPLAPTSLASQPSAGAEGATIEGASAPETTRREKRKKWGDAPAPVDPSADAGERRKKWGVAAGFDADLPQAPARPLPPGVPLQPAAAAQAALQAAAHQHAAAQQAAVTQHATAAQQAAVTQHATAQQQAAAQVAVHSLPAATTHATAAMGQPAGSAAAPAAPQPDQPTLPVPAPGAALPKPAVKVDLAAAANTALQQIVAMTAAMAKVPPNAAIAAVAAALQSNGAYGRSLPGAAMQKAADSAFNNSSAGKEAAAAAAAAAAATAAVAKEAPSDSDDGADAGRQRRKRGRGGSRSPSPSGAQPDGSRAKRKGLAQGRSRSRSPQRSRSRSPRRNRSRSRSRRRGSSPASRRRTERAREWRPVRPPPAVVREWPPERQPSSAAELGRAKPGRPREALPDGKPARTGIASSGEDADAVDVGQEQSAQQLRPVALQYLALLTPSQLQLLPAAELSQLHLEHLQALRVFSECEQQRLLSHS